MRSVIVRALAALAGAAALAQPLAAQSLFSSRGLGYPLEPLDARARGLGGVTTGYAGYRLSLVNPADPVGMPAPGLLLTFQPDVYDATAPGVETSGSTARFPLILVGIPIGSRVTGTLGYGSFLDQNWQVTQDDSLDLPSGRVGVSDRFISRGAVARFRAGVGYRVNERLAVGVAADVFTGVVRDSATRSVSGTTFRALSGTNYTYGGVGLTGGARWQPLEALTVAAAVSGGGQLEVESSDSVPQEKSYANPVRVDAGASARVTQDAVVFLSARWAGWSALNDDLEPATGPTAGVDRARDAASVSLGVEYEGVSLNGRVFPLRLGGRVQRLPFRWDGPGATAEFPDERAVSAGLGARLAGGAALVDLAAERGWRGGESAGVDESFWRFSLSLSLLGR